MRQPSRWALGTVQGVSETPGIEEARVMSESLLVAIRALTGAGSAPATSLTRARRQDAALPYARQTTSLYLAEEQFRCLTNNSCRN